ncbi:hypothetical protein [Propionivibrio limicola]|uniref:hypothetical protein n=1 Tax=Propionivibrio limicola TaxID=167645 RepID=UPI001292951D|nr:hypothetical protein [Propionivibrio limicola]
MDTRTVNETKPADETQGLKDALRKLVRHASVTRLKIHADTHEVEISELDCAFKPGRILASNMVFILVSGDAFRLTFKAHFNAWTAKSLAFRVFGGQSPEAISEKQAIDYFKEYANLVAGNVVALLGENGIEQGISLPLCTRGFYEVFADYPEKAHPIVSYSDFWQLGANRHAIFCSALFEIMDRKALHGLVDYEISEDIDDDDEEIDFL